MLQVSGPATLSDEGEDPRDLPRETRRINQERGLRSPYGMEFFSKSQEYKPKSTSDIVTM